VSGPAVRVAAQAKVNLLLRVLAREAGGHHQIETLFLRIALADEVVVRTGVRGRHVDSRGSDVGPMERNLAYRAAMALREAGGPDTFAIEIEKRIPVGAGLGGGSADAAAVLRALNACRSDPLPDEALLRLAAGLGADVPFLTSSAVMALAWGRGERMLAIAPPPERPMAVVAPPFAISTAEAYGWIDASGVPAPRPRVWSTAALSGWTALAAVAHNDFQSVVAHRHPEVGALVARLREAGAVPAMMTGSGSAVFGVFPHGEPPPAALLRQDGRVMLTSTVTAVAEVQSLA
jgi:4-diphosphocytidyl-2-C-methyl-D-erythritol kinase